MSRLEQHQAASSKAVQEECERRMASERSLQQRIQELSSELAVSQVCH